MNFFNKVYEIVRNVPYGSVMSYGQVAHLAGNPRMARQVGWALHACSPEDHIPWHRIVAKDGHIAERSVSHDEESQRTLLEREGIGFDEQGRVRKEFFVTWSG